MGSPKGAHGAGWELRGRTRIWVGGPGAAPRAGRVPWGWGYLEERGVLLLPVILLGRVFPGDAEQRPVPVLPAQPRVPAAVDLRDQPLLQPHGSPRLRHGGPGPAAPREHAGAAKAKARSRLSLSLSRLTLPGLAGPPARGAGGRTRGCPRERGQAPCTHGRGYGALGAELNGQRVGRAEMSRARGCRRLARSLIYPAGPGVPGRSRPRRGDTAPVITALLGTGLPTPRETASRVHTALRGGGCTWVRWVPAPGEPVQGLIPFTPSWLPSILAQCHSSQGGLSLSLPGSEPSSVVLSGGRGISPRGGRDGAGWYHAPPGCPCKGRCWSRAGGVTPHYSRAWAGWALRSGLIGPPWCDTGAGSSVTTAEPRVTMWGNPAPLPTGSPLAARWVSFPALSHRKSLLVRRRDEAAQGCKASE